MPRTLGLRVLVRVPRMLPPSLLLAGTLVVALPGTAWADMQACLAASEKGQRARGAGKLREARESFIVCGAESCPTLVRRDCVQWNNELATALPTVVFGAKDKQGRDLFNVTVWMDGEILLKRLDGKAVTVDPGKHSFRFEVAGLPPVSEVALIKEGERARGIDVTFESASTQATAGTSSPPTAATAGPTTSTTRVAGDGETATKTPKTSDGHTPYPWIVVGAGGVAVAIGAAILFTTPQRPANCNPETKRCVRLDNMSDADFLLTQQQAGEADAQPLLGYVLAGGGLALVAGGLLWHFLEPTGAKKATQTAHGAQASSGLTGLRVTPWSAGPTSGGLALGTRF